MSDLSVISKTLNSNISNVLHDNTITGFERAYKVSCAIKSLKEALTPDYMKIIMELQGNKLGFKADGVYNESVVKDCLIEAVLTGVQPVGNHFNIIAKNCYITKEGFGYLLANYAGLSYEIIPELPRIKDASGAVIMKISWTLNGVIKERSIDFPVKVGAGMGADGVIGKATRKARAWLYNTITGSEVADGDISDNVPLKPVPVQPVNPEADRITQMVTDCKTIQELAALADQIGDTHHEQYAELFTTREAELNAK